MTTPEIAEICGIHTGDGYLRNDGKRKEFDISGSYEEKEYYDKHIIPLFNNVFNLNLKGRFFPHRKTYGFVIRDINVIKFMHNLGFPYGKKSTIVKIPNFILNSKNNLIHARFLRGYFDTDGSLSFKKAYGNYSKFKKTRHYYPRINISTVSQNLSKDLKKIFKILDINFNFYTYQPKNENENLRYVFQIMGTKVLSKWMDVIGTKNQVKYSRHIIWKKFKFCPPHTNLKERIHIINKKLDPNLFYKDP